jgi:hypothetical protein
LVGFRLAGARSPTQGTDARATTFTGMSFVTDAPERLRAATSSVHGPAATKLSRAT